MSAFYNEIDPFAAAWLRVLIDQGEIAPGIVDERDIRDICPNELAGFDQCHFFAGIGGWSLAARLAGIPDVYPFWSGSCPCQPFSAAGSREGFADERHLWPAFFHLIEQCEPELVVGEQVSGGNVDPWFDLVQADVEGMGYAFGLCPAPSAGFGAPHIRDRAFWLADADGGYVSAEWEQRGGEQRQQPEDGGAGRMEHASGERRSGRQGISAGCFHEGPDAGRLQSDDGPFGADEARLPQPADGSGPANGFWRAADWLGCTDGRWRPVEPSTFPLADGLPARVGRLRGYGNAINAQQAAHFLEAVMIERHPQPGALA